MKAEHPFTEVKTNLCAAKIERSLDLYHEIQLARQDADKVKPGFLTKEEEDAICFLWDLFLQEEIAKLSKKLARALNKSPMKSRLRKVVG